MVKYGFLVNLPSILVGCLGVSVTKVGISWAVKKKGGIQVLYCKRCLHISIILRNDIQYRIGSLCLSHHNYTLMLGKVGCPVYLVELFVVFLEGSVLKVDIGGAVNKKG